MFALYVCVSISALQVGSSVPFSRIHIYTCTYDICSLSDLLHSVWHGFSNDFLWWQSKTSGARDVPYTFNKSFFSQRHLGFSADMNLCRLPSLEHPLFPPLKSQHILTAPAWVGSEQGLGGRRCVSGSHCPCLSSLERLCLWACVLLERPLHPSVRPCPSLRAVPDRGSLCLIHLCVSSGNYNALLLG